LFLNAIADAQPRHSAAYGYTSGAHGSRSAYPAGTWLRYCQVRLNTKTTGTSFLFTIFYSRSHGSNFSRRMILLIQ